MANMKSKLVFSDRLPKENDIRKATGAERVLVIYDQALLNFETARNWLAQFEHGFSVRAGEPLKDLNYFPKFLKMILPHTEGWGRSDLVVVSVGGGSVSDF